MQRAIPFLKSFASVGLTLALSLLINYLSSKPAPAFVDAALPWLIVGCGVLLAIANLNGSPNEGRSPLWIWFVILPPLIGSGILYFEIRNGHIPVQFVTPVGYIALA